MKKLANILIPALMLVLPIQQNQAGEVEYSSKILNAVKRNAIREEKQGEIFVPEGETIRSINKRIDSGEINYTLLRNGKEIYLTINPKRTKRDGRSMFDQCFGIREGTTLVVSFPKENEILEINQQGVLIKQDTRSRFGISNETKKLYSLEEHEEAEEIIENGEKALKGLASRLPGKIEEKIIAFIENSVKKRNSDLEEKLERENKQIEIIPRYNPDKLFGQKLVSLQYRLKFKRNPEHIEMYSITQIDDNQKVEQKIAKQEGIKLIEIYNNSKDTSNLVWAINFDKNECKRTKKESKEDDLIVDLSSFDCYMPIKRFKEAYGLIRNMDINYPIQKEELMDLSKSDVAQSYYVKTKEGNTFLIQAIEYKSLSETRTGKNKIPYKTERNPNPKELYLLLEYKKIDGI